MKKIIILLLISSWVFKLCAQDESLPYWVSQMPTPEKGNFYYRVTHAEERTYEKAYAKAFATAILESSWKLGVEFNTNESLSEIEQDITDNINVTSSHKKIPINKVCEYVEYPKTSSLIRVYILWQVAKQANKDPEFEDFYKCR